MGLRRGRGVQWLSSPWAVTRSHPNPKSRSYESLFFFSSPAWSPLYSFLFQANEPAVKETCIPLYNLRQAWPGCSFSIKQNFSCLSFPVPGTLIGGAVPCPAALRSGGTHAWLRCVGSVLAASTRGMDLLSGGCRQPCRAEPLLCAACSILFSFWQREQISFCMKLN